MDRAGWVSAVCALAVLAAEPRPAEGAGYSLYEQSARALGMGGALTARAGDASSVFFNPAGLAQVRGGDFYGGVTLLFSDRSFSGQAPFPGYKVTEESPSQVFYPVAAYLAHQAGDFGLGLGFYSPFGLATEWKDPDNFSGRFISTKAELESFCFNPAVGWNLSERVRLGLGILAVTSSVRLERAVGRPNPTEVGPGVLDLGTVVLDGGSGGLDFGFNAGVQVDIWETITAGVAYRSQVDALLRGDADFTFTGGTPLNPQIAPLFPKDQKAETELPLPDLLVLGLAHRCGASEFEVDLGWQNWADFQALVVRFDDPSLDIERRERWENAWFLRGGWEYALRPDLDLRLGAYYDRSPQPTESISPLLPDNDRWGLSAGLGIVAGSLRADVYGLLLLSPDRSTDGRSIDGYEGTYDSGAVITGLSLGFGF